MRPIRKKAPPVGVFPKRFLISTLRQLGQEVGLTVPTLVAPANGSGAPRALPVRVHVYRGGGGTPQFDIAPDPGRGFVGVWQHDWEGGFGGAKAGEGLGAGGDSAAGRDAPRRGPPRGQA